MFNCFRARDYRDARLKMQKEHQAEKLKFDKNKKYMIVRHGRMNDIGLFEHSETRIPRLAAPVVIKTEKGLELGEIVGKYTPYKGGHFKYTPEQISQYYKDSEIDFEMVPAGRFARYATPEDLSEDRHLRSMAAEEIQCCRRFIDELGLKMKVIDVEHIFGGERIIFYFMADSRVDFRELVKKIAHEYQTRIEMRQIGPRDEAKLLADYETCGQQCCCQRFLKMLKPVNMRMAKMQKATLDPSKISGYCGRLKCCLRYEDCTYNELRKKLPRKNTMVETQYGVGKVLDSQILTQLLIVGFPDGKRIAIPIEEVKILDQNTQPAQKQAEPGRTNQNDSNNKKRDNDSNSNGQNETEDSKDKYQEQTDNNSGSSKHKPHVRRRSVPGNFCSEENNVEKNNTNNSQPESVNVDIPSKEQITGDSQNHSNKILSDERDKKIKLDQQQIQNQGQSQKSSLKNDKDKKNGQENSGRRNDRRKGKIRNGNYRRKNKSRRRRPNQNKSQE
jgi:cell fate regulator YaaT (PSP1 superfamily)